MVELTTSIATTKSTTTENLSGLSTGEIIGITLAVLALGAVVVVIIVLLVRKNRRDSGDNRNQRYIPVNNGMLHEYIHEMKLLNLAQSLHDIEFPNSFLKISII